MLILNLNLSNGRFSLLNFLYFNVSHFAILLSSGHLRTMFGWRLCSNISGHHVHKVNIKSEPYENTLLASVCVTTRCFLLTFLLKIAVFKKRVKVFACTLKKAFRLSYFGKGIKMECTDCNTKIYLFLEYQ